MLKGLISFSVYGSESLYNDGAFENIAEAKEYFPGWKCRFYVEENAPILSKLLEEEKLGNCEVVIKKPESGNKGMFWRFEAISDPNYDYIIIRDTDQRLNDKDAQMVFDWIKSGLNFHRAHEEESQASLTIMGCAFGIRNGVIKNIHQLMENWLSSHINVTIDHQKRPSDKTRLRYGSDQVFLKEVIWPIVENSCKTYGLHGVPFPPHKPFKWGYDCMYRRITPFTNCTKIFGERPEFAYNTEEREF